MSALDDIQASAEAARDAIDTAKTTVLAALHEAQDKAQQVAGLGLAGVTATVQAAESSLEAAASRLGAGRDAADSAVNGLGEITGDAGAKETAQKLGGVLGHLAQAVSGVDAATGSAHEAYSHAQRAEIDSLVAVIAAALNGVTSVKQAVGDAAGKTEAYRQHIETVAQGN